MDLDADLWMIFCKFLIFCETNNNEREMKNV